MRKIVPLQRVTDARFLSNLLSVPEKSFEDLKSQSTSPLAVLIFKVLDRCQKQDLAWWESKAHNDTRELLIKLYSISKQITAFDSYKTRISATREACEFFGCKDAYLYPDIIKQPEPQINISSLGAALNVYVRWAPEINTLLERSYTSNSPLSDLQRVGVLITLLALESGICSKSELHFTLIELSNKRIRRHGQLFWTSCSFEKRRGERRRQWLSENVVLLAGAIDWSGPIAHLIETSNLVRDALAALRKSSRALKTLSQRALYSASLARLWFYGGASVFLLEFAQGKINSSALSEAGLARSLRRSLASIDCVDGDDSGDLLEEPGSGLTTLKATVEQLDTTQVVGRSPLTSLARILARSDAGPAKADARALIDHYLADPDTPPLINQILAWAKDYLKSCAPRTVKLGLDHLHARLIPVVDDLQAIDDPDVWELIVEEITSDLEERSKALSALSSFARFLSTQYGEDFVGAGRTALSGINAQYIEVSEVKGALVLLEQRLDPDLFKLARVIVELAFGAGLRRSEVDGLLASDIEFGGTPVLKVRPHRHRSLKTSNAKRNIPLYLVEAHFEGHISRLRQLADLAGEGLLFKQFGYEPLAIGNTLFNHITRALQEFTGEPKVKFHSLRHAFCSRMLLGLLYKQNNLASLESVFPVLSDLKSMLPVLGAVLGDSGTSDRFELAAVRTMMGHLQETTTLLHYFHFMDLLRLAGQRRMGGLGFSLHARHGLSGALRNSRGQGARLSDGAAYFQSRIALNTHPLGEPVVRKAAKEVLSFQESGALREALFSALVLARRVLDGEAIPDTPINGWGVATASSIKTGVDEVQKVFLTGALAKDSQGIFDRVDDQGGIEALSCMLSNLSTFDDDKLRSIASDLKWLAEHRVTPYVTYRFESQADAARSVELLQDVLATYPLRLHVIGKIREARRLVTVLDEQLGTGDLLPDIPCEQYLLKPYRNEQRFPHRALASLTAGLMLLISNRLHATVFDVQFGARDRQPGAL